MTTIQPDLFQQASVAEARAASEPRIGEHSRPVTFCSYMPTDLACYAAQNHGAGVTTAEFVKRQ